MSFVMYRSILTVSLRFGPRLVMFVYRDRSEYRANVPPCPSSSAASTIKVYFTVTIRVSDQMIMDRAPTRSSQEGWEENVDE